MARGGQLVRQWKLLGILQSNRFGVSLKELTRRLGSSKRTIQRDLDVLQEVGVAVSAERRGHGDGPVGEKYWKAEGQFADLSLTTTEALSLLLSQRILAPLSGTALGEGIGSTVEKIKALLSKRTLGHFRDLDDMLIVKETARPDYAILGDKLKIINEAITEQRQLEVAYQPPDKKELRDRFCPYTLILHQADLYLLGKLVDADRIRTLKVLRFRSVKLTDQEFVRLESFRPEAHLNGSFGIIYSSLYQEIRVRFTNWAATEIREHKYHPSQKIIRRGKDSVTVEFELANTTEFMSWILHFGRHAIVLKPKKLADKIAAELDAARDSYRKRGR